MSTDFSSSHRQIAIEIDRGYSAECDGISGNSPVRDVAFIEEALLLEPRPMFVGQREVCNPKINIQSPLDMVALSGLRSL
jgi:hypothetical protein